MRCLMESKDYLLIGVCVIAALLLFVRMAKENKVFIGAGILCLLYGGYHVAQAFLDSNIVNILGWVLRGIAVIMLIWMFTVLSQERAKKNQQAAENKESPAEESEIAEEETMKEEAVNTDAE